MFPFPKMRPSISLSAIAFGLASTSSCATSQSSNLMATKAATKTSAQVAARATSDVKLLLTPQMVVNESALGDASQLVDEQQLAGDPLNGKGGAPKTAWTAGRTE